MHLYCSMSVFIASVSSTRRAIDDPELPYAKVPALTQTTSALVWEGFDTGSITKPAEPILTTTTVAPAAEPVVNEAIVITKSLLHIPFTRVAEIHQNVIRQVPGTTFTERQTLNIIIRVMAPGVVPLWFHEILRAFPAELDYTNNTLIQMIVSLAPPDFPRFKNHQIVRYLARNWIKYCINASAISDDPEPFKLSRLSPKNDMPVMVLSPQMMRAYLYESLHLEQDLERRKSERE